VADLALRLGHRRRDLSAAVPAEPGAALIRHTLAQAIEASSTRLKSASLPRFPGSVPLKNREPPLKLRDFSAGAPL
jgi:hypothetical protein